MRVTLGVSNRHIHLNEEDYKILFGNKKIKIVKKLVQKINMHQIFCYT